MSTNLALLRSTYEGLSGENATRLLAALTPDAQWVEAPGFPYAGTYVGAEAIVANVFQRLATEWIDYRAEAHNYIEQGDQIAAFGAYSGTFKATADSCKHRSRTSTRSGMARSRAWSSMSTATWCSKPCRLDPR